MIGRHALPMDGDTPVLGLVALARPTLYALVSYGYVTLRASTALVAFSVSTSVLSILFARFDQPRRNWELPPDPAVSLRRTLCLVLGEQHDRHVATRAGTPIGCPPERGLYTSIAIVGAVGSRKTSACMYPYVE